ncbi:MAG: cobalamin-dependent protein [bacterium]|jgi:methanogenic corrinoid protein MtbC1
MMDKPVFSCPEDSGAVSERASSAFSEALPRMLTLVNDKFSVDSRLLSRGTPEQLALVYDAHRHFGDMLRAVFEFSLYEHMEKEFSWYAGVMKSRGFGEEYFRRMAEAWIIAVHAAIRHREACELSGPLEWLAANSSRLSRGAPPQNAPRSPRVREFLELALSGRRMEAVDYVLELVGRGDRPENIVSDTVLPAMAEIGRLWESNEIGVSDEHAATEISRYALQRVMDEIPRAKALELRALVGCVPGEQHDIGAMLTAAYLEAGGWDVTYLGRSTPETDLLVTVTQEAPAVCVFSMTMIARLPASRDLFVELRKAAPGMGIVVGGHAAEIASRALAPYVDAVVGGFKETHEVALRLARGNA